MSLDDENPTQYFGADAEVWIRPDGSTVQLHPGRIAHLRGRLQENGWARNPGAKPLVFGADTGHRPGCSFGRTPRCTCTYIAQWDRSPEYTAPTYKQKILDEVAAREGYTREEYTDVILAKYPPEQPAPFPMEEKDYYPVIEKPLKALTVAGEIWEPRKFRLDQQERAEYHKKRAKSWEKQVLITSILGTAGWAYAVARGVWGF